MSTFVALERDYDMENIAFSCPRVSTEEHPLSSQPIVVNASDHTGELDVLEEGIASTAQVSFEDDPLGAVLEGGRGCVHKRSDADGHLYRARSASKILACHFLFHSAC